MRNEHSDFERLSADHRDSLEIDLDTAGPVADAPVHEADVTRLLATFAAANFAKRLRIGAQQQLFAEGDPAKCYFLVEYGEFIVHRREPGGRASVRFQTGGDFFIFNCGDRHAANCHAVLPSSVIQLDRLWLDTLARTDTPLKQMLERVHSSELELMLSSGETQTGQGTCVVPAPDGLLHDEPDSNASNFVSSLRGRRLGGEGAIAGFWLSPTSSNKPATPSKPRSGPMRNRRSS